MIVLSLVRVDVMRWVKQGPCAVTKARKLEEIGRAPRGATRGATPGAARSALRGIRAEGQEPKRTAGPSGSLETANLALAGRNVLAGGRRSSGLRVLQRRRATPAGRCATRAQQQAARPWREAADRAIQAACSASEAARARAEAARSPRCPHDGTGCALRTGWWPLLTASCRLLALRWPHSCAYQGPHRARWPLASSTWPLVWPR
jgi:hypothetical protein